MGKKAKTKSERLFKVSNTVVLRIYVRIITQFQSFSERIASIRINATHQIRNNSTDPQDVSRVDDEELIESANIHLAV